MTFTTPWIDFGPHYDHHRRQLLFNKGDAVWLAMKHGEQHGFDGVELAAAWVRDMEFGYYSPKFGWIQCYVTDFISQK